MKRQCEILASQLRFPGQPVEERLRNGLLTEGDNQWPTPILLPCETSLADTFT